MLSMSSTRSRHASLMRNPAAYAAVSATPGAPLTAARTFSTSLPLEHHRFLVRHLRVRDPYDFLGPVQGRFVEELDRRHVRAKRRWVRALQLHVRQILLDLLLTEVVRRLHVILNEPPAVAQILLLRGCRQVLQLEVSLHLPVQFAHWVAPCGCRGAALTASRVSPGWAQMAGRATPPPRYRRAASDLRPAAA